MKRVMLVAVFFLAMCFGRSARVEASVLDWPVLSQVSNVVRCVISDAGTIGKSIITHATAVVVEVSQTVGKCLIYIGSQVTPGIISEPPDHA